MENNIPISAVPRFKKIRNKKVPRWFHPFGFNMYIRPGESHLHELSWSDGFRKLVIATEVSPLEEISEIISAVLMIERSLITNDYHWVLVWELSYGLFDVYGRIAMFWERELLKAFCHRPAVVEDETGNSQRLIRRFGGNAVHDGKFIRWNRFLNIPGPGTGDDRNPNISIYITEEIEKAVVELITCSKVDLAEHFS